MGFYTRIRKARRFAAILRSLSGYGFRMYLAGVSPFRDEGTGDAALAGGRLRETLASLGPTFMKLGQLMSCHPDIFPPAVVKALGGLLDEAPPSPWEEIEARIRLEMGRNYQRVASVDPVPHGAASIAQVHRAWLVSGESVAIKVQRPGVEGIIARDLEILHSLGRYLPPHLSALMSVDQLVSEFSLQLRRELDFHREASFMKRLGEELPAGAGIDIPVPYEGMSSRRVLVMSFAEGTRLDAKLPELGPTSRRHIATDLVRLYTRQLLEQGVMHADPHFGNLLYTTAGRIALLDFGAVIVLPPREAARFTRLLRGMLTANPETVVKAFMRLGYFHDPSARRALETEMYDLLTDYLQRPLGQISLSRIFQELIYLGANHRMSIPRSHLYLVKALSVLENTIRETCPELSPGELLRSMAEERRQPGEGTLWALGRQDLDRLNRGARYWREELGFLGDDLRGLLLERSAPPPEPPPQAPRADLARLVIRGVSLIAIPTVWAIFIFTDTTMPIWFVAASSLALGYLLRG